MEEDILTTILDHASAKMDSGMGIIVSLLVLVA